MTETLHDGDIIVLYTDGATDVPNHALDETQWRELVHAAARAATAAEVVADNIRNSLDLVLPFEQRNDDIALLIVKVRDTH